MLKEFHFIFVFIIRKFVPESPRWLESVGRIKEANYVTNTIAAKAGFKLTDSIESTHDSHTSFKKPAQRHFGLTQIWSPGYTKRSCMVWLLWFFSLLGYYGLTTWLGALLQAAGYTLTKSTLYLTLISLAGVPGFFTMGWLLEAWGRKPAMVLVLLGSAIAAYFYGTANSLTHVIAFGLIMQFFMYGMWSVLYAYTPELYPTQIRATGAGFASSIGRLGALIGPYLVGILLPVFGQVGVFTLGATAFVAAALAVFILGEETKGKLLEEICPIYCVKIEQEGNYKL